MRKLLTPLQYSSTLDELNELRPLQVDDKVKQVIGVPIHNELAIANAKGVRGLLSKGTQQGGAIIHHNHKLDNYEELNYVKSEILNSWSVSFSQRVYKVVIQHSKTVACNFFEWRNPTYTVTIQSLVIDGVSVCNFVGDIMYLWLDALFPNDNNIDVYGFY